MNIRGTTRAVVATVVMATAFAAPPATAAVDSHVDPARDVVFNSDDGNKNAPGNKSADITKFTVAHTAKKIVVTMRLRDLVDNEPFALLQFKAAGSSKRFIASWMRDQYQDEPVEEYLYLTHGTGTVECSSLRARASFEKNRLTISMNRSCLGSPKSVRVGGMMGMNGPDGSGYLDFSHRKGGATMEALDAGSGIPLGPAVKRG